MKFHVVAEEPAEPSEDPAGESDEPSRSSFVALVVVGSVTAWRIVVAFPEVAYVVVGVLGTVAWQKARAWQAGRRKDESEDQEEAEQPDVAAALRRLVGDDKGVLLTRLQKDLGLPDTKAVKALLNEAGISWKPSRTREGNGPAVRKEAIPPAPSPVAADSHGDGCCCRSGGNGNGNNGTGEGPGEGIRVERTDGGLIIYDLADTHRRTSTDKGVS
ncbi:hypothetical protein [Streptomyces sp. SAS_272]|uniref:hypothetical protein n=1 Tax=Streptomyces sp. SAS_272 TaxID=3412747 RepID=UPI00403C09D8